MAIRHRHRVACITAFCACAYYRCTAAFCAAALPLARLITNSQSFRMYARVEDIVDPGEFCTDGVQTALQKLKKFSTYLCSQIAEKSQKNLKSAQSVSPSDKRWTVKYADIATLLFEGIARIIEIHQPLVETYYGPGRLFSVIEVIQKECDRQIKRVLDEFKVQREFYKKSSSLQQMNRTPYRTTDRLDPKELDSLLAEITILSTRSQLYLRFIRRRIMGDIEISSPDEKKKAEEIARLNKLLKECELSRLMHDILGTYVTMEEYFMRESIHKAVSMDVVEENSLTSSMLDDVFFIEKKCLRRAISSSNADIVCAMLNHATSLLQTDFYEVLNEKVKLGFPSSILDFGQAYSVFQSIQPSDIDKSKTEFLVTLNNAEIACEFVRTLRCNLEEEVQKMFPHASDQDGAKLESCLSEITSVNFKLQQLISYGRTHLCTTVVKPRIKPWVDSFQSASHIITDDEFVLVKQMMKVDLIQNSIIRQSLTTSNFDALGGLLFEKELRLIIAYLTTVTTWTIRDKFARLTQIASILNLENVNEILDTWGSNSGSLTWRLTPTEVRQVLALRKDFKSEDIKRLKL
ncbi:conserved oligomeric Golgi complex subunit 4 [Nephila pilipes]|uniref:Conserved oligomeric Golgi complex subunit 4 n=1 Tax=Nephila pilipes TaxID=299642 RepID=A0A8X6PYP5_NEPPI|nr:conserved oligomeric Golgi complex subunit 4 [Nephila pilipes]